MTGAYIDKDYVYAVARIRSHELKLFNKQVFQELISTKSSQLFIKTLKEKGWGFDKDITIEEILASERKKLWDLIDELVPEKNVFNIFRLANDYHNIKAAIKESTLEYPYEGVYIEEAVTDVNLIKESIKNKKYDDLPDELIDVAKEAHEILLHTGDGQLSDAIVDRASIEAIVNESKKSNQSIFKSYAELVSVGTIIKICLRAALTSKDRSFLEKAVAECDSLDKERLITATLSGVDAICSYLQTTEYADAVPEIKTSVVAFEKWCDDLIIKGMQPQLMESFGLGPIAGYIIARENEIKTVRIIYTAFENKFSDKVINERVRESYV